MPQAPSEVRVRLPVETKSSMDHHEAELTASYGSPCALRRIHGLCTCFCRRSVFLKSENRCGPRPANAFQVAVMLLLPRRTWPLLITAHVVGGLIDGFQIHLTALMTVMSTLADVVIFIIAAYGLSREFGGIPRLDSFKAFAKYFLIAVLLAPAISAFVSGFGTPGLLLDQLPHLVSPKCVDLPYHRSCDLWLAHPFAGLGSPKPLLAVGGERAADRDPVVGIHHFPLALESGLSSIVLLPGSAPWAALRLGSVGVSTSMVIVAVISVWGAVHGHGPFVGSDPQHSVLSLLLFLLFASTLFLLLAALVEERERASLVQRALSRRLISAQEQERRRIAREIDDDISQKLAVLSMEVGYANSISNDSSADMKRCLKNAEKHCSDVADELHSLRHQLH